MRCFLLFPSSTRWRWLTQALRETRGRKCKKCSAIPMTKRRCIVHLLHCRPGSKKWPNGAPKRPTVQVSVSRKWIFYLPKFKLEPPAIFLGKELQALGMSSAFDQPVGSANFDSIATRRENDYLYLAEVIHKAFLNLDEKGTEA